MTGTKPALWTDLNPPWRDHRGWRDRQRGRRGLFVAELQENTGENHQGQVWRVTKIKGGKKTQDDTFKIKEETKRRWQQLVSKHVRMYILSLCYTKRHKTSFTWSWKITGGRFWKGNFGFSLRKSDLGGFLVWTEAILTSLTRCSCWTPCHLTCCV